MLMYDIGVKLSLLFYLRITQIGQAILILQGTREEGKIDIASFCQCNKYHTYSHMSNYKVLIHYERHDLFLRALYADPI